MMSDKEIKRRKIARAVFVEAWYLKKQTVIFIYGIGTALKIAWNTVRSYMRYHYSKVRGTTFGNRQTLLKRLSMYDAKDIILSFVREPNNPADASAVQVWASVQNRGKVCIGYLSKQLAAELAPLLDAGKMAVVKFDCITGIGRNSYLGCNFRFLII
ncbi:HIRAN domain-containing protein [Petroclostridium sp. X23]|uniref:HIRAN domain-containing protein n=1 Tax=Petroclostridium sp. X23 TaxID=3045146 RepID=UPI0024AD71ED|nr:HIRAN domain-containing protein [Petroclostridium sp. X23]WHH57193.1 HIRAN domain-containing protein [Petroclostridium sp. X23]